MQNNAVASSEALHTDISTGVSVRYQSPLLTIAAKGTAETGAKPLIPAVKATHPQRTKLFKLGMPTPRRAAVGYLSLTHSPIDESFQTPHTLRQTQGERGLERLNWFL